MAARPAIVPIYYLFRENAEQIIWILLAKRNLKPILADCTLPLEEVYVHG